MGLVLKYAQELPSGAFRYRRRVPKALVASIAKGEFVHLLGDSRMAALRVYPAIHNAVERQLAVAARQLYGKPLSVNDQDSELAQYRRLEERIRGAGFDPTEGQASIGSNEGRQREADHVLDRHPRDLETGDPLLPASEAAFARALYNGPPSKPAPTLTDAMRLYLEYNAKADTPENRKKRQRVERVVANAKTALGGDRKLTEITWHDARAVAAHLVALHRTPATARRYLNDLMGIAALSIASESLGIPNPFAGIEVKRDHSAISDGRQDVREKELEDAVEAIRLRLQDRAAPDLVNIWTMLEYTGCRGKEITGLATNEVFLTGTMYPHIVIRWTEDRRLKSAATARGLPLVPAALRAVEEAIRLSGESPYLFPKYHAGQKGADRASAALGKHVRAVTNNPSIVTYSLRHRVKAKMVAAGVPEDMQERIMGHGASKIGRAYGLREVERAAMAEALAKAFPGGPC